MKISMLMDFKILKRNDAGEYVAMDNSQANAVSVGGYSFDIGDKSVPFDWDAFTGVEHNKVFEFATGKGFVFNDYELAEYYDEQYEEMGLTREDISANFLASVHHIEEFFVNFEDGDKICGVGGFYDNADKDAPYKLELLEVSFEDLETGKFYDVKPEVLTAFNKGERGRAPLEAQIADSANKVVFNNLKEYELTFFQGEENEQIVRAMLTDEQAEIICKKISGISIAEQNITLVGGSVLEVGCIDAIEILDGDSLMPIRHTAHQDEER